MTANVPNVFYYCNAKTMMMKITGPLIAILVGLDPTYGDYVVLKNSCRVLYIEVLRAIYSLIQAFGKILMALDLSSISTITQYQKNSYSSHRQPAVNKDVLRWLNKHYGIHKAGISTRGVVYEYDWITRFQENFKLTWTRCSKNFLRFHRQNPHPLPAGPDFFGQQINPKTKPQRPKGTFPHRGSQRSFSRKLW